MTPSLKMQTFPVNLDSIIQALSAVTAVAGFVGGTVGIGVDYARRRVHARASAYAAETDFQQLTSSVAHLQTTIEQHITESRSSFKDGTEERIEIRERISKIEGKLNA